MNTTYDNVANSFVTVGRTHFNPSHEINKEGDGYIPGYCDIIVLIDRTYMSFKKGQRWTIRLTEVIDVQQQHDLKHLILKKLDPGDSVKDACPQLKKDLFGDTLCIIVTIENSEGGQREECIFIKPE